MTRYTLPACLTLVTGFAASLLLLVGQPSPAGAQRSPLAGGEMCPQRMYADRDEMVCTCDETVGSARLWGTDVYTDDSKLCHAAVHAGAVSAEGGIIRVRRAPGRSSYQGSTRNGVSSDDFGAWESSIVFDSSASLKEQLGGVPLCPVLYTASPGFSGECTCAAVGTGPVWGTNPYTSDSHVCRAARHAGVIGPNGGVVRLSPAPGQKSYGGSTRNGVTSSDYGPWNASFQVSPR